MSRARCPGGFACAAFALLPALLAAEPAKKTSALEIATVATGERTVVRRADGALESPHFSADGSALWFNTGGRLFLLPLRAGAEPVPVDTGFAMRCVNDHGLSPDGTQLVVTDLTETGKALIYLLPVAGGTPRRVAAAAPALWHGWSPDGKTLAYGAERGGNYDVYTIPAAGGPETRLTTAPGNDNGPDYSADGRWIYFHAVRDGGVQVWRVRPDGSGEEPVTRDGWFNWFPHPSPDGHWVLVLSSKAVPETGHPPPGEYVLRLLPVAGGEPRELAHFTGGNGSLNVPCWSRDSTRIAFAAYTYAP